VSERRLRVSLQSERSVGVGEVLRVESVTSQDGGLYVCTADNGAGSKSRDFTVDVQCTFAYLQGGAQKVEHRLHALCR